MKIAIIEDDINMRKSLEIALGQEEDLELATYKSATEALKKIDPATELIITDINMPGLDGIDFIREFQARGLGEADFIIMTGNATLGRAVEAMRLGVKDFLTKPFDLPTLTEAIRRAQKIRQKTAQQSAKRSAKNSTGQGSRTARASGAGAGAAAGAKVGGVGAQAFFSSSPALAQAQKLSLRAAPTEASVLILGESGVGKELFARFIHENSRRASGKFLAINMAAIPANLIESELFGFEKGAFTDATAMKIGLFEAASGGTIFLDEIGEMPFAIQAKLLRALQEKEISRLGSTKSIKIDVRIISATNAKVEEKIQGGEFRSDLFYRLNTVPIHIPPLRERREEILGIAQRVLADTCAEYELGEKTLGKAAVAALLAYAFPGNVRELISVVARAAILSEGEELSEADLFLKARK